MIYESKTTKYTVRVHAGKRTESERKEDVKNAAERFFREIQPDLVHSNCGCTFCEL